MGKTYDHIDHRMAEFIGRQKMFFVATAPSGDDGHVNVSPKGYDSLKILGPNQVLYCDLGGSGIETVAHVEQNGRLTIMFCAFEGAPNIVRLYGRAKVTQFDAPGFSALMAHFPQFDRARNIISLEVNRVSDSCGWGVPFYEFKGERDQLNRWIENKPVEDWWENRLEKNKLSIDGLPGLKG